MELSQRLLATLEKASSKNLNHSIIKLTGKRKSLTGALKKEVKS